MTNEDDFDNILCMHIARRTLLKYGAYGGLATCLFPGFSLGSSENTPPKEKYNLILISIDTLRADHLGCYGYKRPTSLLLDSLAAEGVLFEDVTAPSPWTLPSHASLLTGLYPSRMGLHIENNKLPSNVETLASVLSRAGFASAAIINSLYLSERFGMQRGFQDFLFVPVTHKPPGTTPMIVEQAKKWLNNHLNDQSFLFLHLYDVHSDYSPLPEYKKQFARPYQGAVNGTTKQLLDFQTGSFALDHHDIEHLIDLYDAEIKQLDNALEGLIKFLQQKGLSERSIIVITSDHGEEFFEHGGVLHGHTQYQELVHVPLIIKGPKIPAGRRIDATSSLTDVMPTVLSLLGVPSPADIDGYDLKCLWQDKGEKLPKRLVFAEADNDAAKYDIKRAVRRGRYKLHYDCLTKNSELYDLANDPHEKTNVYAKHKSMGISLFKALKNFRSLEISEQPSILSPKALKKLKEMKVDLDPEEIKKLKSLGYL